ncbi:Hypothetical predicted protein [Olea europaea subsp. europaea]|nr:Hypothetical predicted protein [Olea europaea subsp. europaea]
MNGVHQSGNNGDFEKTFPGCLGRMVNLFDLNVGMAGNRLLTAKPYRDGLPLPSTRSHVVRTIPSSEQVEDQVRESEMRRNCSSRKSNGIPMKALIALEMSKEVGSNRSPTNVVAKLMGLEALPQQQPNSATQRSYYRGYPPIHSDIPMGCWEQQNEFFQYAKPNEYKDVYEIQQQSPKTNCARDKSPLQARYGETMDDRMMAVVRQKFTEAKCLSTDEKRRQSKQFQDALEYSNSNKDIFLKSMQESNPAFSPHCNHLQHSIRPPETRRITILRPSKMVNDNHFSGEGNINEKKMKGACVGKLNGVEKCHPGSSPPANWNIDEHRTQTTRIIVLKPSPVKLHNIKATGPSLSESPMMLNEDFFGDVEDDKNQESREIAKAITQQMREKLGKHRRDETLLSSVFSNGYVGDESSFNKSEIEYAAGVNSDSEVMSPIFCDDRYSSPYYSSFSRASISRHSSVCKEAKKRLSERWALIASNGSSLGKKHMQRSSSTLGEMLSLSETKKAGRPEEEGGSNVERRDSDSHFISDQRKDENVDNSPRNLLRSKSVPVSSAEFAARFNVVTPDPGSGYKPKVLEEATKTRIMKTSLKGTVTSLFFSKNKKDDEDKSSASESHVECCSSGMLSGQIVNSKNESLRYKMTDCLSPRLQELSSIASSPNPVGNQGIISPEAELSVKGRAAPGNLSENHDRQSPISVLDSLFEKEERTTPDSAGHIKPDQHGPEFPVHYIKSNLIDKSPPIGSIARTLSWDDTCVDTASSYHSKPSFPSQTAEEEEGEWFFFVQTLLTAAGLIGEVQSDSFLARWHSSKSPLDPSLRDNYIDFQDEETLHEAKLRQKRSTQKLVFDCVNAALLDIAGYGLDSCRRANASLRMVDQVWARISMWISRDFTGDCGDDDDLLVARVVRNEVAGKGWVNCLRLEMDNLEREIEWKLLEDLVQEAMEELTDRIS